MPDSAARSGAPRQSRQRAARLAHLRRIRLAPAGPRPRPARRRRQRTRPRQPCLRARFLHRRPVPVPVPAGALPHCQGGSPAPYAARPARQHSQLRPRLRRQAARRQRPRSPDTGTGRGLRDGPCVHWLQAAARIAANRRGFRSSREEKPEMPPNPCGARGQRGRNPRRPDDRARRQAHPPRLSGPPAPRPSPRCRHRPQAGLPDQLVQLAGPDGPRPVQEPLACRDIFKPIKRNLRIKRFLGTCKNAVQSQLRVAISVYALAAIIRKQLDIPASLHSMLKIPAVMPFERANLREILLSKNSGTPQPGIPGQLQLFESPLPAGPRPPAARACRSRAGARAAADSEAGFRALQSRLQQVAREGPAPARRQRTVLPSSHSYTFSGLPKPVPKS